MLSSMLGRLNKKQLLIQNDNDIKYSQALPSRSCVNDALLSRNNIMWQNGYNLSIIRYIRSQFTYLKVLHQSHKPTKFGTHREYWSNKWQD